MLIRRTRPLRPARPRMPMRRTEATEATEACHDSFGLDVMVRTAVVDHIEAALRDLAASVGDGDRRRVRSWREAAVRGVHTAVAAAREGLVPLDSETVGRLLFSLTDVPVRDAACGFPTTGPDDPVEALWLDIATRAPEGWGAAPAAVLAYVRWCRGDFPGAESAAAIAVNLDPAESLAPLVLSAARHRIPADGSSGDDPGPEGGPEGGPGAGPGAGAQARVGDRWGAASVYPSAPRRVRRPRRTGSRRHRKAS